MAEKLLAERLQPSLLDRLTDDAPGEQAESRDSRVIDLRELREIVLRDLISLLNTTRHESLVDLGAYPNVATSTINYGVPDFAGATLNRTRALELQRDIRDAIIAFEPRILPDSLEVRVVEDSQAAPNHLYFDIRGDLWAQPLPVELYMRTELDVSTGDISLRRTG